MKIGKSSTTPKQDQDPLMGKIESAAKKRDIKHLSELLQMKPDLNTERGGHLLWNVFSNVTIATMLVQAGAKLDDMSDPDEDDETDSNKYKFFHWIAVFRGDDEQYLQLARLMMDRGANVNELGKNGDTALHLAVQKGAMEFIKELLKRGADVEATNKSHRNPIEKSIDGILKGVFKANEILQLLIKSGNADEETIRRRGLKAFKHCMCEFKCFTEPMQVLVDLGISMDALEEIVECDEQATSYRLGHFCMPINYAISIGDTTTMEFFLKHGVNIKKQSKCGYSALTVALYRDYPDVIKNFIKRGADMQDYNKNDGQYPIHVACYMMADHNIKLFLNLGSDINLKDKKGRTPLALVAEKNVEDSYKTVIAEYALLMSKGADVDADDILIIEKRVKAKNYYEKCLAEIEKMKEAKVYNGISVFDLSVKSMKELISLVKNSDFLKSFNGTDWMFPTYFKNLENKITLSKQIAAMLDMYKNILNEAIYENLPEIVLEKIIEYSCVESIKKLRQDFYFKVYGY